MKFEKFHFKKYLDDDMIYRSRLFLKKMEKRRTVRDFSDKPVPFEIIENAIKTASSAPSGANKQPWHFVIVQDPDVKKKIRFAAEKEEKEFYTKRAPDEWLKDLNQFGTDWNKPFLEKAPYLIIVFKKNYDVSGKNKKKNYYVNESVGIASGFLLAALQHSGLVALVHTPHPMGFLQNILKRPDNEKAVLLIPVGFPDNDAKIPSLKKKLFKDICNII